MSAREPVWKSLSELAPAAPPDAGAAELPSAALHAPTELERREVLRLAGATLALAGASACTRQPEERILPYGRSPEAIVPGRPRYYATAMPWSTGALGLLVESHMGRPTKVEGNPDHPASLGATDAFAQASVLGLYDPDRSQLVSRAGRISTWSDFLEALEPALGRQKARGGAGLRVLTGAVTSPSLAAQLQALLASYPQARWHQYEPVNRDQARAGALLAFGTDVVPRHDLSRARVVVSLEADFLAGPEGVRATRHFAGLRRARAGTGAPGTAYVAEATPSITGAACEHRLAVRSCELTTLAIELARRLGVQFQAAARSAPGSDRWEGWLEPLLRDLSASRGASLVIAGPEAPAEVHALAHALNQTLGNVGRTVVYTDPVELEPVDQGASLAALVRDMNADAVEVLAVLGANPVHEAPADLDFAGAYARVGMRVHLGLYADETAAQSHWHLPEAHFLESWGDARAYDGTRSVVQPLIAPLYDGHSALEVAAVLNGKPGAKGYDLVREQWRSLHPDGDFEALWRRALHDGLVPGTARPAKSVSVAGLSLPPQEREPVAGELELLFRADPAVWDGRFANNAWLQECPRPLSKLVWDNAALIAPDTAERLGLEGGDVVELTHGELLVRAPVWIAPGQARDCVVLPLGYGRSRAGEIGNGVGFDAYLGRPNGSPWSVPGVELARTGERHELVTTQRHHDMEGRDLVREVAPAELAAGGHAAPGEPGPGEGHGGEHVSLYPDWTYDGRAWGLVIDLDACTGCNACVLACQSENNVPVVGKQQVEVGREMQWIRIDRYYAGDPDLPRVLWQPVTCMHCENAPCEVVCPVGATTHSPEGLNEMTYNRCVGTRYCSNNCPYKVRRFNFLAYADSTTESLKLGRNPDVTVRSRGVMEKCTYCVQRINQARIRARVEDRPLADGEIVTACQGVCPAQAITFGDVNDPHSGVSRARSQPHHYGLLSELNTRPRTTYLARVDRRGDGGEEGQER